jgi:hypothetical protein
MLMRKDASMYIMYVESGLIIIANSMLLLNYFTVFS